MRKERQPKYISRDFRAWLSSVHCFCPDKSAMRSSCLCRTSIWPYLESKSFLCAGRNGIIWCTSIPLSLLHSRGICFLRVISSRPSHLLLPLPSVYHSAQSLERTGLLRRHLQKLQRCELGLLAFPITWAEGGSFQEGRVWNAPEALRPYIISQIGLFLTTVSFSFLPRNILFSLLGALSEKRYSSDRCFTKYLDVGKKVAQRII